MTTPHCDSSICSPFFLSLSLSFAPCFFIFLDEDLPRYESQDGYGYTPTPAPQKQVNTYIHCQYVHTN